MSKVYFTKEITPENLQRIFDQLNAEYQETTSKDFTSNKNIAVKVSTGEKGSRGYLKADLIGPLVKNLHGTIVECNTAYDGARNTVAEHLQVAKDHGFTDYAEVDIMDSDGEIKIPVKNGKHLEYDIVGKNLDNYDALLNLAHGKGHAMGGFGANLKNQSIGIASRNGKAYIHSCGDTADPDEMAASWGVKDNILTYTKRPHSDFIESMAEAAKAVSDHFAKQDKPIFYITVMNFLSVDCDCDANQSDPVMTDLGIVGSLDPVANDQAFIDLIWNSEDQGARDLKERIDSRGGRHILKYAEQLGAGSTNYELINLS